MVLSLENKIKLPDRIDGIKVSDILLDVFNEIVLHSFSLSLLLSCVSLQGYCKLHNTKLNKMLKRVEHESAPGMKICFG